MSDGAPQPEKVRSGTFQVDRKRAFELLGRYQLSSPLLFPIPWIRAALASGAEKLEALDSADGFELRYFDQKPFNQSELTSLLDSLPAETADPRGRELARGVICALAASEGATAYARSGPEGARFSLGFTSQGESVSQILESEARSVIGLRWGPKGRPAKFDEALRTVRGSCLPGLLRFTGDDHPAGRLPEGNWDPIEAASPKGWFSDGRAGEPSELFLYKYGVSCGVRKEVLMGRPQLRAILLADHLDLTLSQESVAEGEAWEALLLDIGKASDDFVLKRLKLISNILPALGGWLRDPDAYAQWKANRNPDPTGYNGVILKLERSFALDTGRAAGQMKEIKRWAPVVAWLRDCALKLLADERQPRNPVERALFTTPLYLMTEGLPVTLEELERQRLRFGRLTLSERKFSGEARVDPTIPVGSRRQMLELLAGPLGDRLS